MARPDGAISRSAFQVVGYDVIRVIARLFATLVFRIRCHGRTNYPSTGGALVCANHQSFLDPVLVGLTCGRRLNYLARSSLFRHALLRPIIQFLDAIPIEREGMGLSGLKETLRRLKHGELVLIFPEGTRTVDGRLGPLKPGFCAVARRARVPLIPVGISGAYQVWPRRSPLPRPNPIQVVIGPPISPDELAQISDEQLVHELECRIRECLGESPRMRQY